MVPRNLRYGWSVESADRSQVELLAVLYAGGLLHLKGVLLEQGLGVDGEVDKEGHLFYTAFHHQYSVRANERTIQHEAM